MSETDYRRFADLVDAAGAVSPTEREPLLVKLGATAAEIDAVRWSLDRSTRAAGKELGAAGHAVAEAAQDSPTDDEAPELPPGLRVVRLLGRGGGGSVWLAEQERPQRSVAVKVLRARGAGSAAAETDLAARLVHHGIVRIYEVGRCKVGRDDDRVFIVMDYVEGATLDVRLRADGGAAPRDAAAVAARLELLLPLLDAVAFAHARGIVHGDLKPGNVMVRADDGRPVLLDFGLATRVDGDGQERIAALTPAYAPPEAERGEDLVCASDVYSLGVLLTEALTGARPKSGADAARGRFDAARTRFLDPQSTAVLAKALEPRIEDRYPNAAALADDLRRSLLKLPIKGRRVGVADRLRLYVARRAKLLAAAGFVLACAGVAAGALYARRASDAFRTLYEARYAYRDGRWADARRLAEDLYGGPADVEARLVAVDAALGANDVVAARAFADGVPDDAPPALVAKAELVKADVGGLPSKQRRLRLSRALASGGLSLADRYFAQGLAAETLDEATAAFDRCIGASPHHARAGWSAVLTDVLAGRHAVARQRADELARRWGDHADVVQLKEWLSALRGERSDQRIPTARRAASRRAESLPAGVDPLYTEAHVLLDPDASPWMLVATFDRELRRMIVDGLDDRGSAFAEAVKQKVMLASLLSALVVRVDGASATNGLGARLSMPRSVERILESLPRNLTNPKKTAASLRDFWPTALATHFQAVIAMDARDFESARRLFVRALDEPDPLPGLRAGRARLLANVCFREFRDAEESGVPPSHEIRAAAKLALTAMMDSATEVDVDRAFGVDLVLVGAYVLASNAADGTTAAALWTPDDIELAARVAGFMFRHDERIGVDADRIGAEGKLFRTLGSDAFALNRYARWHEALSADRSARPAEVETARRAVEIARRCVDARNAVLADYAASRRGQ